VIGCFSAAATVFDRPAADGFSYSSMPSSALIVQLCSRCLAFFPVRLSGVGAMLHCYGLLPYSYGKNSNVVCLRFPQSHFSLPTSLVLSGGVCLGGCLRCGTSLHLAQSEGTFSLNLSITVYQPISYLSVYCSSSGYQEKVSLWDLCMVEKTLVSIFCSPPLLLLASCMCIGD
jgi:hypothetical protein